MDNLKEFSTDLADDNRAYEQSCLPPSQQHTLSKSESLETEDFKVLNEETHKDAANSISNTSQHDAQPTDEKCLATHAQQKYEEILSCSSIAMEVHNVNKDNAGADEFAPGCNFDAAATDDNAMDCMSSDGFNIGQNDSASALNPNAHSVVNDGLLPNPLAPKPLVDYNYESSNMSNVSEISQDSRSTPAVVENAGPENGSLNSTSEKKTPKKPIPRRRTDQLLISQNIHKDGLTADKLVEYRWPDAKGGEWYMIQEQVSEFLGVLSFKRKYPNLERRAIEPDEKQMLRDKGLVSEMQADMGLTPIKADQIHDLMSRDNPEKFQEYLIVLRERKKQQQIEKQRELQEQKNDKSRMEVLRKKAMHSAMQFNSLFNRERREERKGYFDSQTFAIHFPRNHFKVLPPELTKPGDYPVALITGQFQEHYRSFTPEELRNLPVNTAKHPSWKAGLTMVPPAPVSVPVYTIAVPPHPPPAVLLPSIVADDASSISTEASRILNSDGESVELGSDIFNEDDDLEDDPETGKSKEERKREIDDKVQQILQKLSEKSKPGPKPKNKGLVASASQSQLSTASAKSSSTKRKQPIKSESNSPASVSKGSSKKAKRIIIKEVKPPPTEVPQVVAPIKVKLATYFCNICNGNEERNKYGAREDMVQCAQCQRYGHPKCLELTEELIPVIKTYNWQCMECKSCVECNDAQNEDKMLFCDHCDRGYHTFCVGLQAIPNGRWECRTCTSTA